MASGYGFLLAISLLSAVFISNVEAQNAIFDVMKYGAKANSPDDIGPAIVAAWKEACASTAASTVLIPKGGYFLKELKLEGPCKGPIEFQLQGTLKAPTDPSQITADAEWITFNNIDQFTISGGGTMDGQGKTAWGMNDCAKSSSCKNLPNNLSLNKLTNSIVRDVTTLDSKLFHVNVMGCQNLTFLRFTVTAPGDSLNTDGIHIGKSSAITITDSNIATGDDCISIGDGVKQLDVTKVTCGPGHGISVGSLGKFPGEEDVVGVHVRNCTFLNTDNGARVKTWPGYPHVSRVDDIIFEDIIVQDVENPVVVDQEYCPYAQCKVDVPSKVTLGKMAFRNIKGTSKGPVAVKLVCSSAAPCSAVEIGDIDLTFTGKQGPFTTKCSNAKPTFVGKQNPPVCAAAAAA